MKATPINLTIEDLQEELQRLKEENERLRSRVVGSGIAVSTKGAVSVYGINSLPVTLYKEPMLRLLDREVEIRKFIADNDSLLKTKPEGFKSIRDLQKEQGLDSAAPIMIERQNQSQSELRAKMKTYKGSK